MLWYVLLKFFIIPFILATPSDAISLHSQFLKESSIFSVFTSYFPVSLYPVQQVFFLHSADTVLAKKFSELMLPNPINIFKSSFA